jgi:hypothetical protein
VVGLAPALLLLLGVEALLVSGAAQGQQSHHVGLRQRRIGAIGDRQFFRSAVQAEGNVVVLDAGRGVQVDGGLNAHRVGESRCRRAATRSGFRRSGAALGNGDAAQQRGRGHGAAQAEIDVAGQLGVGVLEVQLRR